MKKKYIKPVLTIVEVVTSANILACSLCDHNDNHYGHHKPHELEDEE